MSMSGSLMGYENNNDVGQAKCKKGLKPLPVVTSVNAAGITTTGANGVRSRSLKSGQGRQRKRETTCGRGHVNSLWSVWYGIIAVGFQAYIAVRCTRRFIGESPSLFSSDPPSAPRNATTGGLSDRQFKQLKGPLTKLALQSSCKLKNMLVQRFSCSTPKEI